MRPKALLPILIAVEGNLGVECVCVFLRAVVAGLPAAWMTAVLLLLVHRRLGKILIEESNDLLVNMAAGEKLAVGGGVPFIKKVLKICFLYGGVIGFYRIVAIRMILEISILLLSGKPAFRLFPAQRSTPEYWYGEKSPVRLPGSRAPAILLQKLGALQGHIWSRVNSTKLAESRLVGTLSDAP